MNRKENESFILPKRELPNYLRFPHLERVEGSYGRIPSMFHLFDAALKDFEKTGDKQAIWILGPQGAGKTTTTEILLILLSLYEQYRRQGTQIGFLSIEDSLNAGKEIPKKEFAGFSPDQLRFRPDAFVVDWSRFGGEYQAKDLEGGTRILENSIRFSLEENDFTVIEAPAITGFRDKSGKMHGFDRGTTALRNLVRRIGRFKNFPFKYRVRAAAISCTSERYKKSSKRRYEAWLAPAKKPGGNWASTLFAEKDLQDTINEFLEFIGEKPVSLQNLLQLFAALEYKFYPWLLGGYIGIPERSVFPGRNFKDLDPEVLKYIKTLEVIDAFAYIPRLVARLREEGRLQELIE